MPIGIYRIGAVSRRTGLSPATLRLWEEQYGLLTPARSSGGTRLYSEADVERVLFIQSLVRERSYTLEAIARLIEETDLPSPSVDGSAIENLSLWQATNQEYIEEGRRMAEVHPLLRRLVRAESGWRAAVSLVEGVKTLSGTHTAALGLYQMRTNTISFVVTLRGNRIQQLPRPPVQLSAIPRPWQEALNAREAYWDTDLARLDLPRDITERLSEDRTRSFHCEPLMIGTELVGVLVIGSPQPDGISREARQVCERVAVPAGPAIHYFASGL